MQQLPCGSPCFRQLSREIGIEKSGEFGEREVNPTPSQALKGLSFKEGVETRE